MRLINADELRNEVNNYDFSEYSDYSNMIDMINDAPKAVKCPICGGDVTRNNVKCKYCDTPLLWKEGD